MPLRLHLASILSGGRTARLCLAGRTQSKDASRFSLLMIEHRVRLDQHTGRFVGHQLDQAGERDLLLLEVAHERVPR